jgi:hypothetical protein
MSTDHIRLLYRCKADTLNEGTKRFLSANFAKLYSPMFRQFAQDLRILFSNISIGRAQSSAARVDKNRLGLFDYEASHLINNETNRFRCEEILTTSCSIGDEGHFEIRLQPTTMDERNSLIEFDKQDGDAGTGVRAMQAYFEDMARNQPEFYENIKLVNGASAVMVIEEFLKFAQSWKDSARVYSFTFNQSESGKSDMSALMMVKENYAYYLRFDCSFH